MIDKTTTPKKVKTASDVRVITCITSFKFTIPKTTDKIAPIIALVPI